MKKHLLYFACLCGMLASFASCEKEAKPHSGIVTFYGTVTDSNTGSPVSGVQIKMGGSDATISSAVTGSDGTYELPLSIIPTRKGENLRFVLVAEKEGAVNEMIDYMIFSSDCDYVSMGSWVYVAYASAFDIGWEIVGGKVNQSFVITMKK